MQIIPAEDNTKEVELEAELKVLMAKLVKKLPESRRTIITARFGLDGKLPRTLKDLSEELGISKRALTKSTRMSWKCAGRLVC
jgi:DNA-directed RNA polymerase sigma subunit (sigma70/sigma32)